MWANRKLRRDCDGNPSKLGMDVLKSMANREPLGQEWPLSVDDTPLAGNGVAGIRARPGQRASDSWL